MFFKVVGEGPSAGALISNYAKILVSDGSISKPDLRCSAVQPSTAEPGPGEGDTSLAFPRFRLLVGSANFQMNGRRSLPFPFAHERLHLRREKWVHHNRTQSAVDIETEIARCA